MSLYNVKGFILTKKLSLCSAAYIYNLYLMYCYLKIYCISATAFSDQFRVTASSASVQKDSSTAQMRHDARDTPSDLSENERPDIRVSYDSQTGEYRILCEIPGSDNGGYTCFLSLGDEYPQFKKIQSHELSGKTLCRFTVLEYEFSNNLKSVENKVVSCSYSPKNAPSKQSYSEKFNLTVFFPVKIQSPPTTKGTLYSTPTFNATTNSTTTEPKAVATESSSCCETTINPTTETIHPSQLLSVIRNTTPVSTPGENAVHTPTTKTWLILTMATTSTGIFLTGLMGICLCCIRLQPRKKSPVNTSVAAISQTPDDIDAREEHSEENGMKLDHVYCTIPDVAADTHVLYSLAQMPNHPLPV
ncbi:uncharacterized protein LOC131548983 isoform X2 [Onychostoma macrolepis]|uniref:uncharacterized protein LOC131548983 isoform X2 n=1 Tax=Onychostoma macrolepis TaxID=369639 RepID=UPI00272B87A1|nr:uncharacterized protein LOC131548983 isoform X2 [Onychostoma macrolepis]